jgi:hypothetical protein
VSEPNTGLELCEDVSVYDHPDTRELAARVKQVLALHIRVPQFGTNEEDRWFCWGCAQAWPCPTVRLLNGEGL